MPTAIRQKSLSSYLILIVFLVSFLLMLPSWNKYWAPYDEGNYLIAPRMLMAGMIPYRDFFLTMYPTSHGYLLAGLFKVFGTKLIVSRIYNILLLSTICASVFYITRKITSLKYALIAFISCLSVIAAWGEPPIPRSVWQGVMLSMLAVAFIVNFIEKDKIGFLMLSSFFVGLAAMFRHDIGFLTFFAILLGLLVYSAYISQGAKSMIAVTVKRTFGFWVMYSILPLLFIGALSFWLYKINAFGEAWKAMFVWPARFHKWGGIPFPGFSLDFNMIFHRGCLFIRRNKFYIPILVCAGSAVFFFAELWSKKRLDKRIASLSVLLPLGIFYLQQLIFRTDANHLAVSFPPTAILFGILFSYRINLKQRFFSIIKIVFIAYLSLLVILFTYQSAEKYIKDVYIKPFIKKSIEPASFKQGTIYIPDDGRDEFVSLVKYVESNTQKNEKIYVGHLRHNVPQMGWFDLIYFLADRLPAIRYYVMIPGFQSRVDVQEEMILSLERNSARILLLRDFGNTQTMGPLDKYIRKEYELDKIIGTYHIYVKNQ